MVINIGRGWRQQNSVLWPMNHGMAHIAKNRKQQVVGMQNERHKEALKVDGVPLQIFIKNFSGQLCSCSLNGDSCIHKDINGKTLNNPFDDLKVDYDIQKNSTYNEQQQSWNINDDFNKNVIDEELIANYAEGKSNSLIFGGDKTPCGICYGTGYKNGYELFNGKRYVLDYYNNPDCFGFSVEKTYPYSFTSSYSNSNYIIWKYKAPTFFKEFIGIRVRNNIDYCRNYSLYVSFDGINYQDYSDNLIKNRKGLDTTVWLKIVPYELNSSDYFSITHIELFYQLGDFPLGDFAPISETENFELFEALQTTSLELAGDASYITRESVICESKQGYLWKVTSITQHMDSERQIFKNELEIRKVQESENLFLLKLINEPFIILNYRGLEQKQDMMTYLGEFKE